MQSVRFAASGFSCEAGGTFRVSTIWPGPSWPNFGHITRPRYAGGAKRCRRRRTRRFEQIIRGWLDTDRGGPSRIRIRRAISHVDGPALSSTAVVQFASAERGWIAALLAESGSGRRAFRAEESGASSAGRHGDLPANPDRPPRMRAGSTGIAVSCFDQLSCVRLTATGRSAVLWIRERRQVREGVWAATAARLFEACVHLVNSINWPAHVAAGASRRPMSLRSSTGPSVESRGECCGTCVPRR